MSAFDDMSAALDFGVRSVALQEAVKAWGSHGVTAGAESILDWADKFEAYLKGDRNE